MNETEKLLGKEAIRTPSRGFRPMTYRQSCPSRRRKIENQIVTTKNDKLIELNNILPTYGPKT